MQTPEELARQIAEQEGRLRKPTVTVTPNPVSAVDAAMAQARRVNQEAARPAPAVTDSSDWDTTLNALAKEYGVTPGSGYRSPSQQNSLIARGRTKARNSYHLSEDRPNRGARDFSGSPEKMLAFAREVDRRYGKDLAELLHTPYRSIRDPLTAKAHYDHVHVAWGRPYAQSPEELAQSIARAEGRTGNAPAPSDAEVSPEQLARQIAQTEGRLKRPKASGPFPEGLPPIPGAGLAPRIQTTPKRGQNPQTVADIDALLNEQYQGPAPRPASGPYALGGGSRGSERADLAQGLPVAPKPIPQRTPEQQAQAVQKVLGVNTYDPIHQRERRPATPLENLGNLAQRTTQAIPEHQRIVREYQGLQVSDPQRFPRFSALSPGEKGKQQAAELRELQRWFDFPSKSKESLTPFQKVNFRAMQALVHYVNSPENARRLYAAGIWDMLALSAGEVGGVVAKGLPIVGQLAARAGKAAPLVEQGAAGLGGGLAAGGVQGAGATNLQNPNATPLDYFSSIAQGAGVGGGLGLGLGVATGGATALFQALRNRQAGIPTPPPAPVQRRTGPRPTFGQVPPERLRVDRGEGGRFVPAGKGAPATRTPTVSTPDGPVKILPGTRFTSPRNSASAVFTVESVKGNQITLRAPNGTKLTTTPEYLAPAPVEAPPPITEAPPVIRQKVQEPRVEAPETVAPVTGKPAQDLNPTPEATPSAPTRAPRRGKAVLPGAEPAIIEKPALQKIIRSAAQNSKGAVKAADLRKQLGPLAETPEGAYSLSPPQLATLETLIKQAKLPPEVETMIRSRWAPAGPEPGSLGAVIGEGRARAARPSSLPEPVSPVAGVPKTAAEGPNNAQGKKILLRDVKEAEREWATSASAYGENNPRTIRDMGRFRELEVAYKAQQAAAAAKPPPVSKPKAAPAPPPAGVRLVEADPGTAAEIVAKVAKEKQKPTGFTTSQENYLRATLGGLRDELPAKAKPGQQSIRVKVPGDGSVQVTTKEQIDAYLASLKKAGPPTAEARMAADAKKADTAREKMWTAHPDGSYSISTSAPGFAQKGYRQALEDEWARVGYTATVENQGKYFNERLVFRKAAPEPEPPLTELNQGGSLNARAQTSSAKRIQPAPIPGGDRKRLTQIVFDLERSAGKRITVGAPSPRARGTYYPGSAKTVIRHAGDLDTTAHELAHSLDDRFNLVGQWALPRTRSPFDAELLPHFSQHGSPGKNNTVRRAEAVAEWIRAWLINPAEAEKAAPRFAAHFKAKVPLATRAAIRSFGDDIRRHAGLPAEQRTLANVRMEPDTAGPVGERLREATQGTGTTFQTTKLDRLKAKVLDDLGPVMKGIHAAEELRGATPLPSDDPELLIRLHAGVNAKIQNVMEQGMIRGDGSRVAGFPNGFASLLEPLDNSSAAALKADQDRVVSVMVARRTKTIIDQEVAKTGGDPYKVRVSGIGAGIRSDYAEALKTLADHANRPAAEHARIEKAAKLYRDWADSLLDYLADTGRISRQQAKEIRLNNPDYVSFGRVMDDLGDVQRAPAGSGNKLATGSNPIQQRKGSSRAIEQPYVSLMEQTGRAIKEADRNNALRKFRDLLTTNRGMYQGKPLDLSDIGHRVPLGSKEQNLITIFVDGKAERWKFETGIYEALTKWGELPDDNLVASLAAFTRAAITHSPAFATRNAIRDTLERVVTSPVNSGFRDLGPGIRGVGKNELALAGGDQAGHYLRDKINFHREQARIIRRLAKDRNTLVVRAEDLGNVIQELGQKSERVNRLAEYNAALKQAKARGLSDRDAELFAAGKARELMDFAVAGSLVRKLNRYVPFTNAQVQGLRRTYSLAKANPARFAGKWAAVIVAPTLAVWGWNKAAGTLEEYRQLPAYQRDLFWNVKVGDRWLAIPKGHEIGVLASGVERTLDRAAGNKRAFEGYGGSLAKSFLPMDDVPILGGYAPIVEARANRDLFRNRPIVPEHEAGRALELREGTKDASRTGQALQQVIRQDARSIDHVIRGMTGGTGDLVLRASDLGRKDRPDSGRSLLEGIAGLTKRPPTYQARDVQAVLQKAKELNRESDPRIQNLLRMFSQARDVKGRERERQEEAARRFATEIRPLFEKMQGRRPRPRR